jgi:hypothetical protein
MCLIFLALDFGPRIGELYSYICICRIIPPPQRTNSFYQRIELNPLIVKTLTNSEQLIFLLMHLIPVSSSFLIKSGTPVITKYLIVV